MVGNTELTNNKIFRTISFIAFTLLCMDVQCQVSKQWETDSIFFAPESIVYDSINKCMYVSNFNDKGGFRDKDDILRDEFISKIDLDGHVQEIKFIDSLIGPTGVAIYKNKLFIVERDGLSIADIHLRKIVKKIFIQNAGFLNDIAVDNNGISYISDTRKSCIYKVDNYKSEVWYSNDSIKGPNGLLVHKNNLIVGNKNNGNLISISLNDKKVNIIGSNISNNIDGIKKIADQFILSWKSKLYLLKSKNEKEILYQLENKKDFLADFEFINELDLIVIPRLLTNKIIALEMSK